MNDTNLSQEQFEANKMIINTKYQGDQCLEHLGAWTYEQYLSSKERMVRSKYPYACAKDPSHRVYLSVDRCTVGIDAQTGEETVEDIYGDEVASCTQCGGFVAWDALVEDLESIHQDVSK